MGIAPVGLGNSLDKAKRFVVRHGLTFINLWDESGDMWTHYGRPGNSDVWLIDRNGNRTEDTVLQFSASKFQRLVDRLE